jgi:hypothetical protein
MRSSRVFAKVLSRFHNSFLVRKGNVMRNSQVFAKVSFVLFVAALAAVAAIPSAQAALVVAHSGQIDPTTEGWTDQGDIAGNGINDGGVDAWQLNDTGGSSMNYGYLLTSPQLSDAGTNGWSIDAVCKVESLSNATAFHFEYGGNVGGTFSYDFSPSLNAGNQSFVLGSSSSLGGSGSSYTIAGSGLSYQHYKIVYDPATSAASIYVNGDSTPVVTGWTPGGFNDPGMSFWSSSWKTGDMRIASLTFSTTDVPEPGTLTLLAVGLVGLLAYAWRKRR